MLDLNNTQALTTFCNQLAVRVVRMLPKGFNDVDLLQATLKGQVEDLVFGRTEFGQALRANIVAGEVSDAFALQQMAFRCVSAISPESVA